MAKVHVFTSAALNYIPKARVLFESLRKHHPEWVLHLALPDEGRTEIDLSQEPFDSVISIKDLDIPGQRGWTFCHEIVELATAIKPFVLQKILSRGDCDKVLYLDPDTVVFSRLDDIIESLDEANISLTPHQTDPEESVCAVMDNEICSLKHGVFNLGFIGVSSNDEGMRFAKWWSERLYHFCRADICNGLFTDQKWIDLVPAFFDGVAILRSGRHNLATWNLTTRHISGDIKNGFKVNGEPLGFYHFTGFDSGAHRVMAAKNANGNTSVKELISWYSRITKDLGRDPLANITWAFNTYDNDVVITRSQRVVYRNRIDLQAAFPDPFDANGYLRWWNTQGRVEYPLLFDPESEEDVLKELSANLTPGFCGGKQAVDWRKACSILKSVINDSSVRKTLIRRGWHILRREGLAGVRLRVVK